MTFGEAIQIVKQGGLVQRVGWNGKGMFIFQRPADALAVTTVDNVKSLPKSVKDYYRQYYNGETHFAGGKPIMVVFTGYLCMKAADNTIVNGWLASQSDMLADDWVEFKIKE